MRLIDADALIPIMKYTTTDNEIGVFPIRIGFEAIKGIIDEAPTIDTVEIVRCKDCEFCIVEEPISRGIIPDIYCRIWESNVSTDGYCNYGEKQITGKLESVEKATSEDEESTMGQPKSKLDTDIISRQAAIELACWRCKKCERKDCEYKDSCETMSLLEALPSEDPKPPVEPKPVCEDAISRSDTLKAMCAECDVKCEDGVDKEAYCTEYALVKGMPPVEPKRPKGEWILECDAEGEGDNLYRCSECGQNYGCQEYDLANFCPYCGADMKGEEE